MRRGFSLVEVVAAIGIVAITLVALATLVRTAPLTRATHDGDVALAVASDKMEALRAAGYAALPASGSFTSSILTSLPTATGTLAVTAYNAKVKQVVVTVSWQDAGQSPRSVSLTTLVTETGALP